MYACYLLVRGDRLMLGNGELVQCEQFGYLGGGISEDKDVESA